MLMDWIKIIDPNHLSAEVIGSVGTEKVATIDVIKEDECFDNRTNTKTSKYCVFFKEDGIVPLILNKTNAKTLKRLFSPDSDDVTKCYGHKIVLRVEEVKFGRNMTTGIRIKEYSEEKCPICGETIVPYAGKTVDEVKEMAKNHFGEIMCGKCMKNKAKEGKKDD